MESELCEIESGEMDDKSENRNDIRERLSKMSFEDLKRLKEKLGSKIFKEAVSETKSVPRTQFKRANKNRPREVSSKIKPSKKPKMTETNTLIDPRFNRLCGTFNKKHFQNTYAFLSEMRKNEKKLLKKMLKTEKDAKKVKQIQYLIQRMNNQELEEAKLKNKRLKEEEERKKQIEALESGQKPHFKTKYEKKIVDLVNKYSELKKSGKVENYIKKKLKKANMKERKKTRRYFDVNIEK